LAFDDVEGEAEEEVFGGGSDGEGVGVVVARAVVAAAFGGVVARGVVMGGAVEVDGAVLGDLVEEVGVLVGQEGPQGLLVAR